METICFLVTGLEIAHKPLDYEPRRPCTSSTHIIVPNKNIPGLLVYDWNAKELGHFSSQQMGLNDDAQLWKGSDLFNNFLSMVLQDNEKKWKLVTFKVIIK